MRHILLKGSQTGGHDFKTTDEMNEFFETHDKELYIVLPDGLEWRSFDDKFWAMVKNGEAVKLDIEHPGFDYYITEHKEAYSVTDNNIRKLKPTSKNQIKINSKKYTMNKLHKQYFK